MYKYSNSKQVKIVVMSKIDRILTTLGTNNSSQIATAVLAGFKMFFLPIATATDKTATTEQKTYTIFRDIIMEGLALITYIGVTGQIQKHVTARQTICPKNCAWDIPIRKVWKRQTSLPRLFLHPIPS